MRVLQQVTESAIHRDWSCVAARKGPLGEGVRGRVWVRRGRSTAIFWEMTESAIHRDWNCSSAREGPLGEGVRGRGWAG